jgi:hypothetical protein
MPLPLEPKPDAESVGLESSEAPVVADEAGSAAFAPADVISLERPASPDWGAGLGSGHTVVARTPCCDETRGRTVRLSPPPEPYPVTSTGRGHTRPLTPPPPEANLRPPVSSPLENPGTARDESDVVTRAVPIQELLRRRQATRPEPEACSTPTALTPPKGRVGWTRWLSLAVLCAGAVLWILAPKRSSERPHDVSMPLPTTSLGAGAPVSETPPAAPATIAGPTKPGDTTGPSDQAAAIDALVSGELQRAADLYEQLARSKPHAVEYREAARILRDKLHAGTEGSK